MAWRPTNRTIRSRQNQITRYIYSVEDFGTAAKHLGFSKKKLRELLTKDPNEISNRDARRLSRIRVGKTAKEHGVKLLKVPSFREIYRYFAIEATRGFTHKQRLAFEYVTAFKEREVIIVLPEQIKIYQQKLYKNVFKYSLKELRYAYEKGEVNRNFAEQYITKLSKIYEKFSPKFAREYVFGD